MHTRLQSLIYFITRCSNVTKVTKRHRLYTVLYDRCALEKSGRAILPQTLKMLIVVYTKVLTVGISSPVIEIVILSLIELHKYMKLMREFKRNAALRYVILQFVD